MTAYVKSVSAAFLGLLSHVPPPISISYIINSDLLMFLKRKRVLLLISRIHLCVLQYFQRTLFMGCVGTMRWEKAQSSSPLLSRKPCLLREPLPWHSHIEGFQNWPRVSQSVAPTLAAKDPWCGAGCQVSLQRLGPTLDKWTRISGVRTQDSAFQCVLLIILTGTDTCNLSF